MIPYKEEVESILINIHESSNHAGINYCQQILFSCPFYWLGYAEDLKKIIENCPQCAKKKGKNQLKKNLSNKL